MYEIRHHCRSSLTSQDDLLQSCLRFVLPCVGGNWNLNLSCTFSKFNWWPMTELPPYCSFKISSVWFIFFGMMVLFSFLGDRDEESLYIFCWHPHCSAESQCWSHKPVISHHQSPGLSLNWLLRSLPWSYYIAHNYTWLLGHDRNYDLNKAECAIFACISILQLIQKDCLAVL